MNPKERHAYDEHLNAIMIQNDVLDGAKLEGRMEGLAEGLAEGKAEGLAEGLAEGKAEGLAEGEKNKQIEIARKFKEIGLSTEMIIQGPGLSAEEINAL